jgi:predicted component of type VI protein secretion system
MGPTFRIVMRTGPTPGKAFPLEKTETFIGRDLSNDIVINDPEISRRHSRIFLQNGLYVLEDLGSTNGTSINGQRLIGPYSMRNGEIITLGERITFAFEAVQPAGDSTLAGGQQANQTMQPASVSPSNFSAPFNPTTYDAPAKSAAPASPQVQPYQPAPSPYQPVQPAYPNSYSPGPLQPPAAPMPYQPPAPAQQPIYSPPSAPQYQQIPPAPPLAYEPNQSPFTGQVPASTEFEPVEVPARAPIWPYIVIGVLLLVILVLVIDDFRLWCPIFGLCS